MTQEEYESLDARLSAAYSIKREINIVKDAIEHLSNGDIDDAVCGIRMSMGILGKDEFAVSLIQPLRDKLKNKIEYFQTKLDEL